MGIDAEMLVITTYKPTDQEIKRWSWHLADSIGSEHFFTNRKEGRQAIKRVEEFKQDGLTIKPQEGQTFLRLSLWSRYWGPGYERGNLLVICDLLAICAVAEWCEQNIPQSTVYYGGGSGDVPQEPFDKVKREEFRRHLYTPNEGTAYKREWSSEPPFPPTTDCKLCIPDHRPQRYGYGQAYAAYSCRGCGCHFVTRDNGVTWNVGRNHDEADKS